MVKELIHELENLPRDKEVILMSDPEGNDSYDIDEIGPVDLSDGRQVMVIWPKQWGE